MFNASATSEIPAFLAAAPVAPNPGESPYSNTAPCTANSSATALNTAGWVVTHFSGTSPTNRFTFSSIFSPLLTNDCAPPISSIPLETAFFTSSASYELQRTTATLLFIDYYVLCLIFQTPNVKILIFNSK